MLKALWKGDIVFSRKSIHLANQQQVVNPENIDTSNIIQINKLYLEIIYI